MNIDGLRIKINPLTWVFILLLITTGYYVELVNITLSVLIHELSHAYIAKKLKINILQIEIFPFGGAAILDSVVFVRPDIEILIALAGPLSNIIFVFILLMIMQFTGLSFDYLVKINITMALFNLLPGIPLDGGRVLKSILSRFLGLTRAMNYSIYSAYFISLIMIYYAIYSIKDGGINYVLIILAILLFFSSKNEKKMAIFFHLRDVAYKKSEFLKKRSMAVNHIAVLEDEKIGKIINCFLPLKYHIIIVLDKNLREKCRITETQLLDYAVSYGLNKCIGDIFGGF
jgi:stage IV sporulation protein FB